jgi:hypothetical protein
MTLTPLLASKDVRIASRRPASMPGGLLELRRDILALYGYN